MMALALFALVLGIIYAAISLVDREVAEALTVLFVGLIVVLDAADRGRSRRTRRAR